MRKQTPSQPLSIGEVCKLASDAGLTYGEYVRRHLSGEQKQPEEITQAEPIKNPNRGRKISRLAKPVIVVEPGGRSYCVESIAVAVALLGLAPGTVRKKLKTGTAVAYGDCKGFRFQWGAEV